MFKSMVGLFAVVFLAAAVGENGTNWARGVSTPHVEGGADCTKQRTYTDCGAVAGGFCVLQFPVYADPGTGMTADALPLAAQFLPCYQVKSTGCKGPNAKYKTSDATCTPP